MQLDELPKSFRKWLSENHPDRLALITSGHMVLFTDEMLIQYVEWCKTDEGKKYLKGGSNYKEEGN